MSSILIAYFSRAGSNYVDGKIVELPVGNTEIVAKVLEELTGGELFRIVPLVPYSEDYQTCTTEARKELRENARPDLATHLSSIDEYDTAILAYPNWWGTMPMPVWTFLERFDFSDKRIFPLCTHEGSGMGTSEDDLKKLCPHAQIGRGLALKGSHVAAARADIQTWIQNEKI